MKKFIDLLPEDKIYRVLTGGIEIDSFKVITMTKNTLTVDIISDTYERTDHFQVSHAPRNRYGNDRSTIQFFSNHEKACEYVKRNVLRQIALKYEEAKQSLQELREIRLSHYCLLSNDFSSAILKLEKQLK